MGFGKSLCYQTLPFVFDCKLCLIGSGKSSVVLVVSLLVILVVVVAAVWSLQTLAVAVMPSAY